MRLLELFAGTGSVTKVAEELGYIVVSVDITDKLYLPLTLTHKVDIMTWDYTIYPEGYFDVVWASPPCTTFSTLRALRIPKEQRENDIVNIGIPTLRKAEEIINYFKPSRYFIENPQTGRMKEYMTHKPHYDVDYCRYCDWGYKKRTRIWTNIVSFEPKICDKKCFGFIAKHTIRIGDNSVRQNNQYRIPPRLIATLLLTNE
jgi:hypothetical protein